MAGRFIWAATGRRRARPAKAPANDSYVMRPSSIVSIRSLTAPIAAIISSSTYEHVPLLGGLHDAVQRDELGDDDLAHVRSSFLRGLRRPSSACRSPTQRTAPARIDTAPKLRDSSRMVMLRHASGRWMRFLMTMNGGGPAPDQQLFADMGGFVDGADPGRRAARHRRARPERHPHQRSGGQDDADRRPVRRGQGDDRQLRADRGAVQGGGGRAARRFWAVVKDGEGDIRQVYGPEGDRAATHGPARHRRGGLAAGVGPDRGRRWPGWSATSAWPRSWRRTRWSPRWRSGRPTGVPPNPGGWLMLTAKHRAIDRLRRDDRLADKVARARPRRRGPRARDDGQADFDAVLDDDGVERRPAAADLHRLPPGAVDRVAGRADAAGARRADHRGDRPRVPRRRSRPSPSGSSGPSGRWPTGGSRSRSRRRPSGPRGWRRCSRWST